MFLRRSTFAVALVIALSTAAATTQVFAVSEEGSTPAAFVNALLQPASGEAAGVGGDGQRLAMAEKGR